MITVEDISAIKAKAVRKIEVTFETPPPADSFTNLSVRDLVLNDRRLQCTIQGSADPVIKALARFNVVDLISHEPSLEDTFLALYGDDDK